MKMGKVVEDVGMCRINVRKEGADTGFKARVRQ
jgi:hypothetical protein